MTTEQMNEILDSKIQCDPKAMANLQLVNVVSELVARLALLEGRMDATEKRSKRDANIASCLANGIQPD